MLLFNRLAEENAYAWNSPSAVAILPDNKDTVSRLEIAQMRIVYITGTVPLVFGRIHQLKSDLSLSII